MASLTPLNRYLFRFPDGEPSSDRKLETGFTSPVAFHPLGERRKARKGFREFDTTPNATLPGQEENRVGACEVDAKPYSDFKVARRGLGVRGRGSGKGFGISGKEILQRL